MRASEYTTTTQNIQRKTEEGPFFKNGIEKGGMFSGGKAGGAFFAVTGDKPSVFFSQPAIRAKLANKIHQVGRDAIQKSETPQILIQESSDTGSAGSASTGGAATGASPTPQVCARPLEGIGGRWFNHAFVNDPVTGSNYAIRDPSNIYRGCANTTDASGPPDTPETSLCKPCQPKEGQTARDVSSCLRSAHSAYNSPNVYMNDWDVMDGFNWGPNSNTYAATLAKCCADSSAGGLGRVPGWNHSPAPPCS